MWIVSQNGTFIANTDTMSSIQFLDNNIVIFDGRITSGNSLGVYSSPEKAAAVREMIIDAQHGMLLMTNAEFSEEDEKKLRGSGKIGCAISVSSPHSKVGYVGGNQVFRMPQDEDVVV